MTAQPFRCIVAGDRRFKDYDLLAATLDRLLAGRMPDVVIVSGCAPGADHLGELYATARGLTVDPHPADWAKHGKAAGPIRNRGMGQVADAAVVFSGGGPGSRSMIEIARELGLALRVIKVEIRA